MDSGFLGHNVPFSIDAGFLHPGPVKERRWKDEKWIRFKEEFLTSVCAALNIPPTTCRDKQDKPSGPKWWQLVIDLENAKDDFDYIQEFSDTMDDALNQMLSPRSIFSEVYQISRNKSTIALHVLSSSGDIATKDYKTKLSTNKGLIDSNSAGLEGICHDLYRKERMDTAIIPRHKDLNNTLHVEEKLCLPEDARLQFKRLYTGMAKNKNKALGQQTHFKPKNGQDYVDWIWNCFLRGLGEYIAAFAKNRNGGAIYYGVKEAGDHSGYIVEGLRLTEDMVEEIKKGICEKVRHDMLWIERDVSSGNGYKELSPQDIRCQEEKNETTDSGHFAVDFIKLLEKEKNPHAVKKSSSDTKAKAKTASNTSRMPGQVDTTKAGKATSEPAGAAPPSQAKYVLEVRVAPFNGVVFYDPQGPEAYRMQETAEDQFQPVRLSKKEWLETMRDHGWCSRHMVSKEKECDKCISEK